MYIVTYRGPFAFIKPWTAVRDGETFSQQFLTPSIMEGIEKKLFPELLSTPGIQRITRHKLDYCAMSSQQEVTQARGWEYKNKVSSRNRAVIKRSLLLSPVLTLAFEYEEEAVEASKQHICLCRNEDILLPDAKIQCITETDFDKLKGFEMRFGQSEQSFPVGYNRFMNNQPMYGWLEYNGNSLL